MPEANPTSERVKLNLPKPPIDSGPGIPMSFYPLIVAGRAAQRWKTKGSASGYVPLNIPSELNEILRKDSEDFSVFTLNMNLQEYDFEEEDEIDPAKLNVTLDVTALDRYNEDVRKYRRIIIDECRLIPPRAKVDMSYLVRLEGAIQCLCRSSYYGTLKAQSLAEATVPLIVWTLNRRNLPIIFHVKVLQALSEMMWISPLLKTKLKNCLGIQVLHRLMRNGLLLSPEQACWAAYTFAMSAVGSADIVREARGLLGLDEVVGELAFDMYWYDWPANFASILQGIVWGPFAVSPSEEFQFL